MTDFQKSCSQMPRRSGTCFSVVSTPPDSAAFMLPGRLGRPEHLGQPELAPHPRHRVGGGGGAARPGSAARGAGRHRVQHAHRVGAGRPGHQLRRPAPPPRCTRTPRVRNSPTSSSIPIRTSSWRRTPSSWRSCASLAGTDQMKAVILLDGTDEGALSVDALREKGRAHLAEHPSGRGRHRRHGARLARHADLHLRHHRAAQGRRAHAQQLDVRGGGRRRTQHHRPRLAAVLLAAAEPRVRQGGDDDPAADRLRLGHRRRASTRSSPASARRTPRSCAGPRASSRRSATPSGEHGHRHQGQDRPLGRSRSAASRAPTAWRASRCRSRWASRTRSPTGSCSPR